VEQKILLSLHRKGLHPGQGETPDFSPCRSLSLYADHSPCMQLIDYLPLHAEWGVVDWAPLILLRGTEGNKSSLETCANFRVKNYTPCFLGWREYYSGCKRAGLQRACRPPQLPRAHAACSAGARVLKTFILR